MITISNILIYFKQSNITMFLYKEVMCLFLNVIL